VQDLSERVHIIKEKQAQSGALRSSLADCDASIAGLEDKLAKSKVNIHNLEAKLDAAIHLENLEKR
jgi:septal ring factor EnvC (AmiA/AmiB activator)